MWPRIKEVKLIMKVERVLAALPSIENMLLTESFLRRSRIAIGNTMIKQCIEEKAQTQGYAASMLEILLCPLITFSTE